MPRKRLQSPHFCTHLREESDSRDCQDCHPDQREPCHDEEDGLSAGGALVDCCVAQGTDGVQVEDEEEAAVGLAVLEVDDSFQEEDDQLVQCACFFSSRLAAAAAERLRLFWSGATRTRIIRGLCQPQSPFPAVLSQRCRFVRRSGYSAALTENSENPRTWST